MKFLNPFKKKDIILHEAVKRGFLSNYITILTSFRQLLMREKISVDRIFVSPAMFSLYGNPSNWFESERIAKIDQKGKNYNTINSHDLDGWPTQEQLNLVAYIKYFPYNRRVKNFIETNLKIPPKTLGLHYRGTDHNHTDRVEIEAFLIALSEQFESGKFEKIYVATDEDQIIEKVQNYFHQKYRFDEIIFNQNLKSSGNIGVHFVDHDLATKILLGDEVILDSHSISKCQTVIAKTSNIINYARILNPDLHVLYKDLASNFRR